MVLTILKILHSVRDEIAKHHIQQWIPGLICFCVMMNKISLCFSLVALALSVFAAYVALSNPVKDQSANLIATLGVICTVLIGWQILSLVSLHQYEKRIDILEKESRQSKDIFDDAVKGFYASQTRSDGLIYRGLGDLYHSLRLQTSVLPVVSFCKELFWRIAEIEICLYTLDVDELRRTKTEMVESLNSEEAIPDYIKKNVKEQWEKCVCNYRKSNTPKPEFILDEIEYISQYLDSVCS